MREGRAFYLHLLAQPRPLIAQRLPTFEALRRAVWIVSSQQRAYHQSQRQEPPQHWCPAHSSPHLGRCGDRTGTTPVAGAARLAWHLWIGRSRTLHILPTHSLELAAPH